MLKRKIVRYKLMEIHQEYVRVGKFDVAKRILELLRRGKITLYLSDTDWEVEHLCENMGLYIWYDRRGYKAVAHLQ